MFVVKSSEMKEIDRYMIETIGLPSLVLMENAAKTVVHEITKRFPLNKLEDKPIVVLCGTGNNGGDGLCIARWLRHIGYNTQVLIIGNQDKFSKDTDKEYALLKQMDRSRGKTTWFYHDLDEKQVANKIHLAGVIVDAMIGTGCSRKLSDVYLQMVDLVNNSLAYVFSVDIPTGINSDNGKIMGKAVRAKTTISFCLPKAGLVLYPGSSYAGEVIVTDIGIIEEAYSVLQHPTEIIDAKYMHQQKQRGVFNRNPHSHKGIFGKLGIIAGDKRMLGATILAAKAAYKAGAGLVRIFVHEDLIDSIIKNIPECVIESYSGDYSKDRFDKCLENFVLASDVVLIGPGLSKSLEARHMVHKVLQMDVKAVLDADALNIISEHMEWFEERRCSCILTPHIGEMSRLTGYAGEGIDENTLQFADAFCLKYGVDIILKSSRTVIAAENGERYILMAGNSGMATAGSGDVLAGIVASLYTQGMNGVDSCKYGSLLHSISGDTYADEYGEHSLTASDLIDNLWRGI